MAKNNDIKPVKDLKYDEALFELQEILSSLQDETLSIDDLTMSIKRASELLEACNSRLRTTQKEVEEIIVKLGLGD
jgi:exodeoxyribonuclease VII small subunit|tara:strand:+ start:512 stop:739 length:228 start_codon:yes stop_codon:yes gene_type:complete